MNLNAGVIFQGSALLLQAVAITYAVISYNRRVGNERIQLVASYLDRFSSSLMVEARQKVDEWIRTNKDDNQYEIPIDELRVFANFFQELGTLYEQELLDKATTHKIFRYLVIFYWENLNTWVSQYRIEKNNRFGYDSFQKLYESMIRYKRTSN